MIDEKKKLLEKLKKDQEVIKRILDSYFSHETVWK